MKTVAAVILVAALTSGLGCARSDWIDRTLVTVDVTGTWQGTGSTGGTSFQYTFNLKQEGAKVAGSIQGVGFFRDVAGPVTGTVAGDVLTFRQTNSPLSGEMTVSGDEMIGTLSTANRGPQVVTLRRVK
jgi:hypothetical protein